MVSILSLTNKGRRTAAFTLAEYMVAMTIGLIALSAATVLWGYASKTTAMLLNYSELSMQSKITADRVSQKLRNAVDVKSFSSNHIVLLVHAENQTNGFDTVTITYDPVTQKLTQTRVTPANVTEQKTLLSECSSFQFKVYQRTPQYGTNSLYDAPGTNTAKVVQMQWSAARKLTGDKNNVQSLVSSKVVIRSK